MVDVCYTIGRDNINLSKEHSYMINEELLPAYLYNDIQGLKKALENGDYIDVWLDELYGSINIAQHNYEISIDEANYLREKYIW